MEFCGYFVTWQQGTGGRSRSVRGSDVPETSSCVWPGQDLEDLETDEETDLEEGDEEDEQKIQKDEL